MKLRFLIFPLLALTATAKEVVFEAFEGDGFDKWTEEGDSFGNGPSAGGPPAFAGLVQGWSATSFACSFTGGDGAKGSLSSAEFTIDQDYIHFLVGGGKYPGQTSVQLISDGEVLVEAVGENDHLFRPVAWDVRAIKGQKVQLRILDARDGSWGFVMADHLVFSDTEAIRFPQPTATKIPEAAELISTDAVPGLTIPAGTYARLFATAEEHQLISPTALCLDEQGNVLVTETHRFRFGVQDNRNHTYWILDDIASDSTAYRRALHERFKEKFSIEQLTAKTEKVRILADTDNDGVADSSKVFSDGYNDVLDGTAAGIFSLDGTIYLACIPHIWTLRDKDGDGVAEEKTSLFEGFGTRVSISGHDLNGFALGPDGRLYGTIGDRSMRVTSKEGTEFFFQNQGAVFRFDPDGSNFETIHTGLRNPKEIAFDQWGNAVTVDNNSDQGDQARLVYIMEGADTGWRVGHQNLHTFHKQLGYEKRPINQWMQEKQWAPQNDLQPAFLLPPLLNFSNGPSGLTYQPGTGISNGCENSFLICDYKGGGAASGIWAFGIESEGAGMRVIEPRKWNWGAAVTDVEFGYDGKVYVTDFVKGWKSHNDGRLYTISSEANDKDPLVAEVSKLVSEGFSHRDPAKLLELLDHPDQRVRLRATLALSHKPEGLHLFGLAATQRDQRLKRLHGVWGLWMLARREQSAEATETLLSLLADNDSEIRSQAAKALGEAPLEDAGPLATSLRDPSARVRAFAAISLGRQKATAHVNDLIVLLAENSNSDLHLRHAGIMGLVGCATPQQLAALKGNPSTEVRIAAVVALRRLKHPGIVAFLFDQDAKIADEVIRAVHDVPIEAARPAIAALLSDYLPGKPGRPLTRMQLRRIVHSAFRTGTAESVAHLLQFSGNPEANLEERLEALRLLSVWDNPPSVDQSLGRHMPLPPRDLSTVRAAFEAHLPALLEQGGPILAAAIGLAGQHGMAVEKLNDEILASMVANTTQESSSRIRALELLAQRNSTSLAGLLPKLIKDPNDAIAIRTLSLLTERNPTEAINPIRKVIGSGNDRRKQHAWSQLATLPVPEAVTELTRGLASLQGSTHYPSYALELVAAADARPEKEVKNALAAFRASLPADDPLGEFRLALRGGDPEQGAALFQTHPSAQCLRCHQISAGHSAGGAAGPNLSDIGLRHDAEYILHSLLDPSAAITPGYGVMSVTFNNDTGIGGVLMEETESTLVIKSGTDLLRVNKSDIKVQTNPITAMLPTGDLLTKYEMRDLVSYLVKQKKPPLAAETDTRKAVPLDPDSLLPDEQEPGTEPESGTEVTSYKLDPEVMKEGKAIFNVCSGCHGPDAKGMPGLAPPLAMSDWVNGPSENLIRIQLRGLIGPIKVSGQEFNYGVPMPPQASQTDEQIAAVLTYVRNSFGNASPPVTPDLVASFRDEVGKPMLTEEDLIPPPSYPPKTERSGPVHLPPSSIFDDEDLDDGWPWWAWALILFWGGVCLIPLVKQFKKNQEEE